jgi:PadR family transcriptional regulator, regulatory protein AphA
MPLEHAILAFLSEGAQTGYALKKLLDQSVGHFWTTTQSHIYKALDGLEQKGLASPRWVEQHERPNRKEYAITEEGREELRRWLTTPIEPAPVREAWLIQLYFAQERSNAEIAGLIEARIAAIREGLAALEAAAAGVEAVRARAEASPMGRVFTLRALTLDFGLSYYRNELAWLDKALDVARGLKPLPAGLPDHGERGRSHE